MINLLSVFIGGGIGSLLRHLVCLCIRSHWAVMTVNVLGAILIGAAFQFFMTKTDLRPEIRNFVITGMLGGFTTFSTYMLDFGTLLNTQRCGEAWLYLLGSILLGVVGLFAGMKIGQMFFPA